MSARSQSPEHESATNVELMMERTNSADEIEQKSPSQSTLQDVEGNIKKVASCFMQDREHDKTKHVSLQIDETVINMDVDTASQGCSTSLLELVEQQPTETPSPQQQTGLPISPSPSYKDVISSERLNTYEHVLETERICNDRLQRALSDAGEQSQGIAVIEAWVLNNKHTHLVRPEGAWWRDPKYTPPPYHNPFNSMKELARLEDQTLDNYHETKAMQPGQGLVGKLWTEGHDPTSNGISEFGSYHGQGRVGSFRSASRSFRQIISRNISQRFLGGTDSDGEDMMYWADIDFIANDEEHIPEERYKSFLHAGISQVSGVIFDIRGYQGIVIYFAKSDTPLDILRMKHNTSFLISAADCIGATIAAGESRRMSLHQKNTLDNFLGYSEDISGSSSIFTKSPKFYNHIKENQMQDAASHRKTLFQEIRLFIKFKLIMLYDKAFGEMKAKPPPSMPFSESLWVFFGAIITLSLVLYMSHVVIFWNTSNSYTFPVGPFGALANLLFALPSAPVSQPRNVIGGTLFATIIGLSFSYFKALPIWFRQALGTSTTLAILAKLGLTHPPAGALALICSSGTYHWGHMLFSVIGNFIALLMAILVNNLNKKRQYPQYWK
jgi:hypothetical protein